MRVRVFRQALAQVARSLTVLTLGAGAFYYLVLLSSSAFLAEGFPDAPFFRDPPRAIEAFLGGSANFFEPSGWLAAAMTHPVSLALLTGAALSVASGAVATEVERGTIDLVLARPVGRVRFLVGKAAATLAAVTMVQAGALAGALIARLTVSRMEEIPLERLVLPFVSSWVLFLALGMVGLLVSARSSLRSRAVGLTVGLIVAWYFANFIALLIDEISGLRYASPFHYYRPADIVSGDPLGTDVLVLAGLALLSLAGAVRLFVARDLTR